MERVLTPALARRGGLVRQIREADWASTPLGPMAAWPAALRTLLGVLLGSAQPMFLVWGEKRVLLYNDALAALLGDRHPAALGRDLLLAWPEAAGELGPMWQAAMGGAPVHRDALALASGTAQERHLAVSCTPVRLEDGRVGGIFCTAQETTAQVLAERHAREEAERVQLALDAGAIRGTWTLLVAEDLFVCDELCARAFGIDPAAGRAGVPLARVIAAVHPEDADALARATAEVIAQGGQSSWPTRVRGEDGAFRWIEAAGRALPGPDGRTERLAGVILDLEARRAVEAERDRATRLLETFVEAVPGVAYAKDREGRFLIVNRGMSDVTGRPPEAVLGRTDAEVLAVPDQAAAIMATDRRILETGQPEQVEEVVSRPDGTTGVWLSTKAPLRDAAGAVTGLIGASIDISARKAAEAALAESEARFRFALDAAGGIGTWDWDVTADRVHASETFARLFGLDPADGPRGRPVGDYVEGIHPDDRAEVARRIGDAVAAGGEYRAEFRIVGGSGPTRWVIARGRCLRDAEGGTARFPGVTFDITARKAAEAALAESEARFRNMADHAPVMMWVTEPDGRCSYLNRGWHDFTGQTEEEARGFGWLEAVHPDDADRTERVFRTANAARASFRLEYRLRRADGAWRWAIDAAAPRFGPAGEFLGYVGSVIDIHERREIEERLRESEARYRLLFESIESGFCIVEVREEGRVDYRVIEANAAFYRQTGFPEAILGRWLREAAPGLEEHWFETYGRVARTGEPVRFEEGSDLLGRWFDVYAFRLEGAEPGRVGILFNDISARRGAEEALRELNETLEARIAAALAERARMEEALRQSQKMEAVGQLTGGIAHDFNNMLAAVIGSLDLLQRRLPEGDARARRYLDGAMEGARRAATLTQRLLAFSRQQPLRPEPIDVGALVEGMSDLLQRSLGPGIRLETALAPGAGPALADPNQLENAILNLAVNARDAMPRGGRLLLATAAAELATPEEAGRLGLPPGPYLCLSVADSGQGMPPEVAARAFDPFFTTKPVGQGTGLGLSQVYGFVRQSGGHVALETAQGRGTTVRLYLPRVDAPPPSARPHRAAAEPAGAAAREVVLVVEDEALVRAFTAEALRELGYGVVEAESPAAALGLLASRPEIALMFTDIVMPDLDGRRLAEEALRRRPDLRVVLTTGYTRDALPPEEGRPGGLALLPKPFTVKELAATLREAFDRPR